MPATHPLLEPDVRAAIERTVAETIGAPWSCTRFVDLGDRASHPCGLLVGRSRTVFAKFSDTAEASLQFGLEVGGLAFVSERSGVATPGRIGAGVIATARGSVLLLDAVEERPRAAETDADWEAVGRSLAVLHRARGPEFGRARDGWFGPLPQDNAPVASDRWADFYAERRVLPLLRSARDAVAIPPELVAGVERVVARLPELVGPEPAPSLLHGDAQANNLLRTTNGTVLVDVAPYFGHPEIDLALVDYFEPVPDALWHGYRELSEIDEGFGERRELWRIFAYLAVITVDGTNPFGASFIGRLEAAVHRYR